MRALDSATRRPLLAAVGLINELLVETVTRPQPAPVSLDTTKSAGLQVFSTTKVVGFETPGQAAATEIIKNSDFRKKQRHAVLTRIQKKNEFIIHMIFF